MSIKRLISVYLFLILLLFMTVGIAYLPLGTVNLVFAATIATVKTALVVWCFMELTTSDRLSIVLIAASVMMLGVAAILTFTDYLTRF